MLRKDTNEKILNKFGAKIKTQVSLKGYTTFKIGGPAEYFVKPKDALELKRLLGFAKANKIKLFILGAGSNILVRDSGVKGLIVYLQSPYFKKIVLHKKCIAVGCGCSLSQIISYAKKHKLGGIEFLIGVPGTLGGALVMNAGGARKGANIGDFVENVTVMDYNSNIKTLSKKDISFSYRHSGLGKYIVLAAKLKLQSIDTAEIEDSIREHVDWRKKTQNTGYPNAGCVFRNPAKFSAGKLIDDCRLKGHRVRSAVISDKHANFILNTGNAYAADVLALMKTAQKAVKNKFGISLKPEIKIW